METPKQQLIFIFLSNLHSSFRASLASLFSLLLAEGGRKRPGQSGSCGSALRTVGDKAVMSRLAVFTAAQRTGGNLVLDWGIRWMAGTGEAKAF